MRDRQSNARTGGGAETRPAEPPQPEMPTDNAARVRQRYAGHVM